MNGTAIREFRDRLGLSQREMAEAVSQATGRTIPPATFAHWEHGRRKAPADVSAFLDALAADPAHELPPPPPPSDTGAGDTEPRDYGVGQPAPVLAAGSSYAHLCEQFFELVATAVGMIGAALGSPELMRDGAIIDDDKKALGAAYGKLAETNETFRNMLIATDKQGAYLAVALTTGATVGKLWRNHQATNRDLDAGPVLRAVETPAGDGLADIPPAV